MVYFAKVFSRVSNSIGETFLIVDFTRAVGVKQLLSQFSLDEYSSKRVALKANLNSADAFSASTHSGTLQTIVETLKGANDSDITLADQSGMGNTGRVLEHTAVLELSEKLGFKSVVLCKLTKEKWINIDHEGTHWLKGFLVAEPFT